MPRNKMEQLSDLVITVFRLNGALTAWGDEFAASEGLSTARWQMLGAIALAGRALTAPQIAAQMGMTRQGAQKQLHVLVDDGLIEAQANPMHKRSPLYDLTRQGRTAFESIDERWKQHAAQLASQFKSVELESATGILTSLVTAYSDRQEPEHEA